MTERDDGAANAEERGERPVKGALSVATFHEEEALGRAYDWDLIKRLLPFLKRQATLLGAALLAMPLTTAASLAPPYLQGVAVESTILGSYADLRTVVVLFAAAMLGEFVARFAQTYLMQLAGQRAMADLRRRVFQHIQRLPVGYFDRTPVGRVVTRVTNDIDSLSEFFASGAVTAVADILMLVGIVGIMLFIDWELSLVTFLALPPLAILVNLFRRFARKAFRDIRTRIAQLNAYLAEQVQGIAVVQAFGREARTAAEYRQINAGYRDANYRSIRYDALLYSVVESIAVASVAIILFYASTEAGVLEGDAETAAYVGTVVAFYEYIQKFFIPIRDLSTKYTIIQSSLASAERIFGLLDVRETDAEARDVGPAPEVPEDAVVAFRDVTFAYRRGHPVLHDVSLDIRKGETVAVVGATGSGKTTLTALLLRLYEIEQGAILLEGRDVRTFERHALRQRFAVVPQDVFLFAGTVLENLTLGDPVPDEARARDALARVGGTALVARREGELHARVEERGANFSAGERQLLAFARALYRDPTLLILDEATANIDSETEAQLQEAVLRLVEGRTSLVIAHRLSTIQHADRIIVMHHGRIAEQGTHAELIRRDGIYARLHRLQFREEDGEEAARPSVG